MILPRCIALFLCLVLAARFSPVRAFETDQYNLPARPLADIGPEVNEYVEGHLRKAVAKINEKIRRQLDCLEKGAAANGCGAPEKARAELARLRAEATIVREVFRPMGGGFPPFTRSGTWMEAHEFRAQPARYKTSLSDSIYRTAPTNYLTISETVNLFGVELGTDKIAHIFQQGYTYYRTVEGARAKGATAQKAAEKAARWGRMTEHTYYGTLVSGVFSNADLAANYAGLKFYQALTRPTRVGDRTLPPVLVLKDGFWAIDDAAALGENLLKPFITAHLNEALNPSIVMPLFGLRAFVFRQVERRACDGWRARYPQATARYFVDLARELERWHGEDYGFKASRHFISVGEVCFGRPPTAGAKISPTKQLSDPRKR